MEQLWYGYIVVLAVTIKDTVLCQHRFGYAREYQRLWSKQHPSCGGRLQSPIHIVGHKAIPLPLPALETAGFHDPLPQPVLSNNGHSVSLSLDRSDDEEVPWIFGAVLDGRYNMESLHFHWGSKNSQGSEHVLNGIQYPAEMHIIFRSNRYSSVQEAQLHSDGLAVLAFFIQLRERANEALWPLLNGLREVRADGKSARVSSVLMLADILPRDMEVYYTYRGSLTTPPCSQAVVWIVFPDCIPVSFRQVTGFDPGLDKSWNFRKQGNFLSVLKMLESAGDLMTCRFYAEDVSGAQAKLSRSSGGYQPIRRMSWKIFKHQLKGFRRLTAGNSSLVDNYRQAQPLGPRRVFVRQARRRMLPRNSTRHLDWLLE